MRKVIIVLLLVLFSCRKSVDSTSRQVAEASQMIEIRYIGEDGDEYYKLVISNNEERLDSIEKSKVDSVLDFSRTAKLKVSSRIVEEIKSFLDDGFETDSVRLKDLVDYSESPIVGYEFSYFFEDSLNRKYWCVTNSNCKQKLHELIDILGKEAQADSLITLIKKYYLIELENPGWGNVQYRVKQKK